ncbi:LANO_0D10836g1_1 [Lachancea nothofagi CBS 11611]|uniref:Protein transport protein BOS1 n=1 Tax=Lachancea nothofagi CBS 11611 TaxID=1266666 RepID=A0A1G4JKM9_9SACH|nr:LANO_0D10836g1_1 [Lachancea nothofagi CBS 11611]
MNALFNHATKQKTLLQRDLAKLERDLTIAPISLQGSIASTLVSLEKTIEQYKEHLTRFHATNPNEDESSKLKYQSRLETLQTEYNSAKGRFQSLKKQCNEVNSRERLIKSSSNPFDEDFTVSKRSTATAAQNQSNGGNSSSQLPLYQGLQQEQSVFERGNAQLDHILEMGQQSLGDIMDQNAVLHKMEAQMTKSMQTLGVSNETINRINKRVFKDKFIFWIALVLMFAGFYFVLKLLR